MHYVFGQTIVIQIQKIQKRTHINIIVLQEIPFASNPKLKDKTKNLKENLREKITFLFINLSI